MQEWSDMSAPDLLNLLRECHDVVLLDEESSDLWTERQMRGIRERLEFAMSYIQRFIDANPEIALRKLAGGEEIEGGGYE